MDGIIFDRQTSETDHSHQTFVNTIETYSCQIRDQQAIPIAENITLNPVTITPEQET